jgi:septum formation protein
MVSRQTVIHATPTIVLVSASPRRRELLATAGYRTLVCPANAPEDLTHSDARAAAIAIARQKLDVLAQTAASAGPNTADLSCGPWLAADTMVVHQGVVLGKPAAVSEAKEMLERLSGSEHEVVTGVVVRLGDVERSLAVTTKVTFRPLSLQEIEKYVATQEPMDKAGAYGIQGVGGALVDSVFGSYTNVVGLPLAQTIGLLTQVCEVARG